MIKIRVKFLKVNPNLNSKNLKIPEALGNSKRFSKIPINNALKSFRKLEKFTTLINILKISSVYSKSTQLFKYIDFIPSNFLQLFSIFYLKLL